MRVTACVCVCGYCMHCMHVWPQACRKQVSRTERVFIMTLRLPNQTMATSLPPLHFFLSLSLCSFHSCTIQQSLDLNCKANCSTHSWREKKVAEKKKKKPLAAQRKKEEQLQAGLAIALRREDLALFISETTNTKNIFDVPERQQDYICMELTVE